MKVSRKTGEHWVREYNENNIDGLMHDYSNCGLESELYDEKIADFILSHSD